MKIIVDRHRCSSIGMCEAMAPEYFQISDSGKLQIVNPDLPACHRALVEEAVTSCPTSALSVEG